MNSRYSRDNNTEEDKDFFDKYSPTGESEWTQGSVTPFDNDTVLSERHYHMGKDFTGVGPIKYRRADSRIYDDVADALYRSAEVDASDVEVSVKDGIVILKGAVDDRLSKKIAEMTAERIPGVMDIQNEIIIENPRKKGLMRDNSPFV